MPGNSEINVTNLRRLSSPPESPVRLPDCCGRPEKARRDAEGARGQTVRVSRVKRRCPDDTAAGPSNWQ